MKKILTLLVALSLMAMALAGCSNDGSSSSGGEGSEGGDSQGSAETIKIAYIGPLTGDNAEYGTTMSNAVQIAVDDINADGGILDRELELVSFDDKNDATEATTVAEMVCSDEDVVAVIGHFSSGVALAASEVYEENGMPYIAISAAHPDLTIGEYIFRNNALYDTEASSVLQTIANKGAEKFGILIPNSDAGVSVQTELEYWLSEFGDAYAPELVTIQKFDDGATDLNAQVQEMIAAGCDVVYTNAAYSTVVPFINQYKTYDDEVEFIVTAACFSPAFLEAAGEDANGVVLATSFFYGSANEAVSEFVNKYVDAYGENPSNFCGQSYDAAYSIYHAIKDSGEASRDSIQGGLFGVDFVGLTGGMAYNESGECLKQQTLVGVEDGEWVEYPGVLLSANDYLDSLK